MSDPIQTVLTAARATKYQDGTPAFEHVSGKAELPGKGNYPALIVTLYDGQRRDPQQERGQGLVTEDASVQGIIYHPVETIDDLKTEARTSHSWTDARQVFAAFLYELWREDPTDPDTGQAQPQARAPNATLEREQRSTRTVQGKSQYAIGWELAMDSTVSPGPLP